MNGRTGKRWSICHGGDLKAFRGAVPATLSELLEASLQHHSEAGLVYLSAYGSEHFQSYAELMERARTILAGLRCEGLGPGDKVLFQFDRPRDFVPAFVACVLGGFLPVLLTVPSSYNSSSQAARLILDAWRQLKLPPILTTTQLAEVVRPFFARESTSGARILDVTVFSQAGSDDGIHRGAAQDLAVLSLTSGSTGNPKFVALTHDNVIQNVLGSVQISGVHSRDVSLNWLRLEHVAVLIRCCLRDIYVGNLQIQAPLEAFQAEPLVLLDWMEKHRVTFAAIPNFALSLISRRLDENSRARTWDLSSLRSIISVAEPVVPRTARTFHEKLRPHGLTEEHMHSGWGMSETAGTVTFSHSYLSSLGEDDAFVEAGAPMPNFSVRIVDDEDRLVEEGTIGQVQAKGPMVASSYYGDSDLNHTAYAGGGWLRTGDLGFLKNGRLTITGRQKNVIIINGQNHSCRQIEATVEELDVVEESTVVAIASRTSQDATDQCVICFQPRVGVSNSELGERIRQHVTRRLGLEPAEVIPLEKESIPRNWRGKLDRLELKRRLDRGEIGASLQGRGIDAIDFIGQTAFNVAQWRVVESERADPLFCDHVANIFLDQARVDTAQMVDRISPATRFLVTYRAKVFDDELIAEMERGTRQVVILGAGLDSRAIRLGRDSTLFFEIDKKEVCSFKAETLKRRGYDLHSRFVPCDYTADDFLLRLQRQGFDSRKPTYFLWEGNTMYLSADQIVGVLRAIRERVDSFRISFDYLSERLVQHSQHGPQQVDSAKAFERLNAPWIGGFDDIQRVADDVGYTLERNVLLIDHLLHSDVELQLDRRLLEDYYVCTIAPSHR